MHDLLKHWDADGVVATGIVVGCVLLGVQELLWMVQISEGAKAHLVCRLSNSTNTIVEFIKSHIFFILKYQTNGLCMNVCQFKSDFNKIRLYKHTIL